jgi:hypothetical protein
MIENAWSRRSEESLVESDAGREPDHGSTLRRQGRSIPAKCQRVSHPFEGALWLSVRASPGQNQNGSGPHHATDVLGSMSVNNA